MSWNKKNKYGFPLYITPALAGGGGLVVNATRRPVYPPGETWYRLYSRLGGLQGRSERVRKISPSQGFNPRTVQLVASLCTD
jgi:hypothetical protein